MGVDDHGHFNHSTNQSHLLMIKSCRAELVISGATKKKEEIEDWLKKLPEHTEVRIDRIMLEQPDYDFALVATWDEIL
jgi:hypothetical protein